ncbi:MAG: DNA-processing protein DprA [Candidatus Wolfebacteria bacterium]|nr:DNA-processing protein DprA [Candidatus Wolfebacteria bacterium]
MSETIKRVSLSDEEFPVLLREIPDPPSQLYYKGVLPKDAPGVGIVGTRKASSEGRALARDVAEELSRRGFLVVSGLALGVDGAAHEGAIAGGGKTIAVLANGLNEVYPRQHEGLARRILETRGALLSEYEPDSPSFPNQFLERNRIVSGLSIATIFIEVPIRSGALATARQALLQGREVLVFPGPHYSKNYEGSHMLLRNGARIVTSVKDILEDLFSLLPNYPMVRYDFEQEVASANVSRLDALEGVHEKRVYEVLQTAAKPLTVDNIAEMSTLEPHIVNQTLTFLFLSGFVEESGGSFHVKH